MYMYSEKYWLCHVVLGAELFSCLGLCSECGGVVFKGSMEDIGGGKLNKEILYSKS